MTQANLLAGEVRAGGERLLAWSGWLHDDAVPDRGVFPRDFRIWTDAGWSALRRACDALLPALNEHRAELVLRPHARQVLCDAQACVTFLRAREGQPIRLLLDPASLLAAPMLPMAEEHLARLLGALGSHPAVVGVLLANVQTESTNDDLLVPVPLHRGIVDSRLIVDAWRGACSPDLPCILLDAEFETQAKLLEA